MKTNDLFRCGTSCPAVHRWVLGVAAIVVSICPEAISAPPALDLDSTDAAVTFPGATDDLETSDYLGGTGDWLPGGWTETGETTSPSGGNIRNAGDNGTRTIRIHDGDNEVDSIQRSADLTGAMTASLSLDFRHNSFDNADEYTDIEISSDGAAFVLLERLDFSEPTTYTNHVYDITAYISATTTVRFSSSTAQGSSEYGYIDNVVINTTVAPPVGYTTSYRNGAPAVAIASPDVAITDSDSVDNVDSGSGAGEVTSGTPLTIGNTDGSGAPDYLDIDADDDGIPDNVEAQSTAAYSPATGGDLDRDGLDDNFDSSDDTGGAPYVNDHISSTTVVTDLGDSVLKKGRSMFLKILNPNPSWTIPTP